MRIFFPNATTKYPPTAGRDIHRYQLIKNLTELGHEVHSLGAADENPFTIKHRRAPWSVLRQLRAADVLYCRVEYAPNHATDLTLPRTAWLVPRHSIVVWEINVGLHYSPHEDRPKEEVDRAIARFRRTTRRVDAVIAVSKPLADGAREVLGLQNVHVLQNASDPDMFRRDLPRPEGFEPRPDRLNITFIASRANLYHDTPLILDAARLAERENWPLEFHVLGESEKLFPADLPGTLHHHGRISYLDIPKYLAAMDVGLVLMWKHSEGSPLKLFDYLASGCVPICSPSQAIHEVLDGTEAGIVGTWNPHTLCRELLALHNDRPRLERMRAAARQLVLSEYSWRRVAEKTVQIMQDAMQRRATS
jgi:glycosyltransferase involved in cell wall biosynthesis